MGFCTLCISISRFCLHAFALLCYQEIWLHTDTDLVSTFRLHMASKITEVREMSGLCGLCGLCASGAFFAAATLASIRGGDRTQLTLLTVKQPCPAPAIGCGRMTTGRPGARSFLPTTTLSQIGKRQWFFFFASAKHGNRCPKVSTQALRHMQSIALCIS